MLRSSTARIVSGVIVVVVALGLLRYKPWQRGAAGGPEGSAAGVTTGSGGAGEARQKLTVGFLPVT
jgi:hypothetical protein